jgi:hypothetical protein
MFSGMAGILIKLIKRMKKMNPATGERLLTIAKAISPSAPVSVTNLERNSKTRILSSQAMTATSGDTRNSRGTMPIPENWFMSRNSDSRPSGNFGRQ